MKDAHIIRNIISAIDLLQREERPLQSSVNERTVAHRLAVHMESLFRGWDIDCEYNKHGTLVKRLKEFRECDEEERTGRFFPDVIVHKRTNETEAEDNL